MVETLDSWLREVGPWGYLALFLASLIEYLVPPFPGDTVVLLGGLYAVRGERSLALVFLSTVLGGGVGVSAMYGVGRLVATRVEQSFEGRVLFGFTHAHIRAAQERMRTHGTVLLLVNRFLPTFRTVLFVGAGAARMGFWRVLALGVVSTSLWNAFLLGVGYALGGNAERVEAFFVDYRRAVFAVMVAAFALLVTVYAWPKVRK